MTSILARLPKIFIGALLLLAVADMLAGVFLRYVVVAVTDYFDWPGVSFFWVEEVGEFALCWLTLVGAAIGILERTHFALGVLAHRLPRAAQRSIGIATYALIAAFGAVTAFFGWRLTLLNSVLTSAGLGINLGWLYASAAVGGALILAYGIAAIFLIIRGEMAPVPGPEGH